MSAPTVSHSIASRTHDWVLLTKPGIVLTNVMMVAVGLSLAPGEVTRHVALGALLGTGLLVAACGALNQFLERDTDRLMERTSTRPLPSKRCSPVEAITIGALGVGGGAWLLLENTNLLTAVVGLVAVFVYLALYTPMKRWTAWSVPVGAVAGAFPPLMGYVAVTSTLDLPAVGLFAILFLWQIPHFLGIALFRASDYEAAGLEIGLAAIPTGVTVGVVRVSAVLLVTVAAVFVWWLASSLFFSLLLITSVVILAAVALRPIGATGPSGWGRRVFLSSLLTLPLLTVGALLDVLV